MSRIKANATQLPFPDESFAAIVTSPPYNVGIEYGDHYQDNVDYPAYVEMAHRASNEMYRVLEIGGRAWVNVMPSVPVKGNHGGRIDLQSTWKEALRCAGLSYRDTVIWNQGGHDGGCAWGSWLSSSSPNLRGGYEVVISVFKRSWTRTPASAEKEPRSMSDDLGGDWTDLVRNVWNIKPVSKKQTNFPAAFPRALAARCIRLSTSIGERVLDPFVGSGTTVQVANDLRRIGVGVDLGSCQDSPNP